MKILIVGRDSTEPEALRDLSQARPLQEAKFRAAEDLKTAFQYLDRGDIDCIVLDLDGQDSEGRDAFRVLHSKYGHVPIIVTTRDAESVGRELMQSGGAVDYLVKSLVGAEARFRRILFAIECHRRGPNHLDDSLQMARPQNLAPGRADPDLITTRPHRLRTIHVPEVGPKLPPPRKPRKASPEASLDPNCEELLPLEIDIEVDLVSNDVNRKLTVLAGKLDALLGLLLVLLVLFVGFLFWSRRPSP